MLGRALLLTALISGVPAAAIFAQSPFGPEPFLPEPRILPTTPAPANNGPANPFGPLNSAPRLNSPATNSAGGPTTASPRNTSPSVQRFTPPQIINPYTPNSGTSPTARPTNAPTGSAPRPFSTAPTPFTRETPRAGGIGASATSATATTTKSRPAATTGGKTSASTLNGKLGAKSAVPSAPATKTSATPSFGSSPNGPSIFRPVPGSQSYFAPPDIGANPTPVKPVPAWERDHFPTTDPQPARTPNATTSPTPANTAAAAEQQPAPVPRRVVVSIDKTSLFHGATVVGSSVQGTVYDVLAAQDKWLLIEHDGRRAWVNRDDVRTVE